MDLLRLGGAVEDDDGVDVDGRGGALEAGATSKGTGSGGAVNGMTGNGGTGSLEAGATSMGSGDGMGGSQEAWTRAWEVEEALARGEGEAKSFLATLTFSLPILSFSWREGLGEERSNGANGVGWPKDVQRSGGGGTVVGGGEGSATGAETGDGEAPDTWSVDCAMEALRLASERFWLAFKMVIPGSSVSGT